MDIFEQLDLAGPDAAFGVEIDPHAQGWQRPRGGFSHGTSPVFIQMKRYGAGEGTSAAIPRLAWLSLERGRHFRFAAAFS